MKSIDWKDIAEFVGISAIVASLVFVGLQLKQSQEIAIAEAFLSILASEIEATDSINENADLWARANNGAELSAAEQVIFENLVRTLHRTAGISRAQLRRLGHDDAADGQLTNFAIFLHENPAARQVWVTQSGTYNYYQNQLTGRNLNRGGLLRAKLAELDRVQSYAESN